ncbi:MAG: hypothetical protein HY869_11875 [Chloroflexi bacterium]|nr:hypothetical protein [Chloroflexota bacterium]
MDIVECRSDSEYVERPLSLLWEGRRFEIAEILARWRGPGEKGFRVKTADGQAFELTYREIADEWQIQPIERS